MTLMIGVQAHPMSEEEPQMSSWNGGIGAKQLKSVSSHRVCVEWALPHRLYISRVI